MASLEECLSPHCMGFVASQANGSPLPNNSVLGQEAGRSPADAAVGEFDSEQLKQQQEPCFPVPGARAEGRARATRRLHGWGRVRAAGLAPTPGRTGDNEWVLLPQPLSSEHFKAPHPINARCGRWGIPAEPAGETEARRHRQEPAVSHLGHLTSPRRGGG